MRFLPTDAFYAITRLIFCNDAEELFLDEISAEDFMNNDYEIQPGDPVERHHHDPETGRCVSIEYVDLGIKYFCLKDCSRRRTTQRELNRIPRTQRMLARILDKRLYEAFNEEIKDFYDERNAWRLVRVNYGIGGLKREFGEDWKQQFDDLKKERQRLQRRRDALRHVHYDQIVKLQELRERDGEQSNKLFTVIDKDTDLDELIEKQHVRANKPLSVKMPIIIDDDFFNAI